MKIKLAKIDCDTLLLDKSGVFAAATPAELTVEILEPIDRMNPTFILTNANAAAIYNYCYVPLWDKYYFLSPPEYLDGYRCAVSGAIDALTSNAAAIKNLPIAVNRSGSRVNNKIVDRLRPSQANRQCETIKLVGSFSPVNYATDICYILTTQGGAHSGT